MMACDSGHPDIVQKLIQARANINLYDEVYNYYYKDISGTFIVEVVHGSGWDHS